PSTAAISREISSDCWARRGETSPASASATRTAWLLAHIHCPSLHHELDPLHRAEVLFRVALHGDQVREGAVLDHAELSFHPQELGIVHRRGLEYLDRGHASAQIGKEVPLGGIALGPAQLDVV